MANRPAEIHALKNRYSSAVETAKRRGAERSLNDFENVVERDSQAVINRSIEEVLRLASDSTELYANYYKLAEAEVRLPKGGKWDLWRRPAEEAVLPGFKENITFAALTLDKLGSPHYGECACLCKTAQVAHRATVFEQNCVLFMSARRFKTAANMPLGFRADWSNRGKLAVAKLGAKIQSTMGNADFPSLLLHAGPTGAEDEFIEVHIYGPLSIHSFDQVSFVSGKLPSKAKMGALKVKLAKFGVPINIV